MVVVAVDPFEIPVMRIDDGVVVVRVAVFAGGVSIIIAVEV